MPLQLKHEAIKHQLGFSSYKAAFSRAGSCKHTCTSEKKLFRQRGRKTSCDPVRMTVVAFLQTGNQPDRLRANEGCQQV